MRHRPILPPSFFVITTVDERGRLSGLRSGQELNDVGLLARKTSMFMPPVGIGAFG